MFLPQNLAWLEFIIFALVVVFLSTKLSKYISAINEKSPMSAGFIGLVLLSAITSLPELITSITSVTLDQPTMAFGNVLGSNAFNLFALAIINIVFFKKYIFNAVSKDNILTSCLILGLNMIVVWGIYNPITIDIMSLHLSLASVLIFALYCVFLFWLYKNGSEGDDDAEPSGLEHLTLNQVLLRGVVVTIFLVIASIILTKVCDEIALNNPELGATVVGALLLAIATSLPEVVSTLQLARMGQGNMAIGGIVGSNLFNLNILFIGDFFYTKQSTFQAVASAPDFVNVQNLVIIGTILTIVTLLASLKKVKNVLLYLLPSIIIIIAYVYFLSTTV